MKIKNVPPYQLSPETAKLAEQFITRNSVPLPPIFLRYVDDLKAHIRADLRHLRRIARVAEREWLKNQALRKAFRSVVRDRKLVRKVRKKEKEILRHFTSRNS